MSEQRQRILDEIYATEKSYVESMGYCIEYFYKTLNSDKNPTQMTKEEVQNLFQHYDQILNINKGFKEAMDDLREKNLMGEQIGKLFTQYIPFFKVYIPFVSHYDRVNMIMDKYEREEGFYETMMKIMETIPTNNPLDLRSYLIMPVQRLPRYELLVKDLLKHTEETHPDYVNLQTAYEKIKETTMMVNERSKEFEQRNNVLKVNDYITGFHDFELIQPDRALILEGELIKVCKKANKPRYFYLFNDMIVYGIGFQKITVSEYFFLKSVQLTEDIRYENSFAIYNDIKSFTVICKDAREKEKWFNEIKKHVEIQKKLSATKEENNRPVWVPDKDALNCLTCGKQFTTIIRRHHCRKCGRCICGDCSKGKMVLKEGGEPERVCIYCFDATKATADSQKQTIKKMQNCDKNEDLFNTLNCNATMNQTGKTKRQRKKSNAELGERKTFAELMNGSNEETKKASQSMMFDFVHDEDISLKSSNGKPQSDQTQKMNVDSIYESIGITNTTNSNNMNNLNNTNDINSLIGSNNVNNMNNNTSNISNMNGTERRPQTLGDMQTTQNAGTSTQRNAFVEMSASMKRRDRSMTTNQLNMSVMFDSNTNANTNNLSNGNTIDGGLEAGRKSPRQRPRIGDRRTQKMQTIDFSDLQNESIQTNDSLQGNDKQRLGVQHSIPLQNNNQNSKTRELDHEKKKELMLEGLETLSREYHQGKTPRSTTKNSSPSLVDQKRSQSAQIASPMNSSPSPNTLNSSFDKPFDFSSTNNFNNTSKHPKSSTNSPQIDTKRNSIPDSFDFSTQNNLFDSKRSSTPSGKDAATVNMMPPQSNTSNQLNQVNKTRTRQFQKRSNTTVNAPTFRQNQSPQISMMYDFTSNNNNLNQQNQQSLQYNQSQQMQQSSQYNQSNDLFNFSNSQPQTQLHTPKEQPKKLGITIENGNQKPSFTRKQPTAYQTQTLGRKQFLSKPQSDNTLNILMSPGNQPTQSTQTNQMNQISALDELLNPTVPLNQLNTNNTNIQNNQNVQNNQMRQNYQMQPMQISIDQSNGEEQKKTTHKRRSMSREGKRRRSKSRDKDEPSENMKKLTELYDQTQKEQQLSLQHAQIFNCSNSFFASPGTPTKGLNNSLTNNANNSPGLHPFFNSLQTENKMTLSKKDRHTLIFTNTDEIMKEGSSTTNTSISNTNGIKESKVSKNRRIYEQKIKKQKEDEKRDFMLRSSVILSEFK